MLHWWSTLDFRGKLIFWGVFGLVVNGILYFNGLWMPKLLFAAIAMLMVSLFISSDNSDTM
jgi:hypothetical protein